MCLGACKVSSKSNRTIKSYQRQTCQSVEQGMEPYGRPVAPVSVLLSENKVASTCFTSYVSFCKVYTPSCHWRAVVFQRHPYLDGIRSTTDDNPDDNCKFYNQLTSSPSQRNIRHQSSPLKPFTNTFNILAGSACL